MLNDLKRILRAKLDEIDIEPLSPPFNVNDTLKGAILSNDNISIEITAKDKFNVKIDYKDMNKIISASYYIMHKKIEIQEKEVKKLINSDSIAWFLVTMYYSSFYASNEICNLMGHHNLNITNDEKKNLLSKNTSLIESIALEFLNSQTLNFYGKRSLTSEPNTVVINFENGGGKPHELAWNNLYKVINEINITESDSYMYQIITKNILHGEKNWERPNSIRNKWNYSNPSLYFEHDQKYISDKIKYFNDFKKLKLWVLSHNITYYPQSSQEDFITIMFIHNLTLNLMESIKEHLIADDN